MKNKKSLFLISAVIIAAIPALFMQKGTKIIQTSAGASAPTTVYLNDNTEQEIRDYYADLRNRSESQLTGQNLLASLKGVITKNITYFTYAKVSDLFVITDRDWANSPAESFVGGTYDATNNRITGLSYSSAIKDNPYIHMLYHDYTVKDKTRYKGDGDISSASNRASFDKEHCWSQTHGFATTGDKELEGAGSDLHHLIAGAQHGNQHLHNNYSYGFVGVSDVPSSEKTTYPTETKNNRGTPLFPHASDKQNKVFEPQDCDKGDIARALLYMVACYNNLDGSTPTKNIPALNLVDYVISENSVGFSSENIENGYYGVLSDILAWHKMDPVDEYEIHRNNLIYNNFQKNRNPFIDFPEWVDYIWGTSDYDPVNKTLTRDTTPTGSVNLDEDVINGYKTGKEVTKIEVTHLPNKTVYNQGDTLNKTGLVITATYDDESTEDVTSKCTYTVDMTKIGEQAVQVSYKGQNASFNIIINKKSDKKGCFGAIEATSLVVSLSALTLLMLLIIRKMYILNK